MHRFYLPPEECSQGRIRLNDRDAHHAARVLRLQSGDAAEVLDGAGGRLACRVASVRKSQVDLDVVKRDVVPPSPWSVTLIAAVPKGQAFDTIAEQATELGVSRLVPLLSERCTVRWDAPGAAAKQAKWRTTAIEAIKQCGSAWLPRVDPPIDFASATRSLTQEADSLSLVAALRDRRSEAREVLLRHLESEGSLPSSLAIWIGPEGDFTSAELDRLLALGVHPITLGPQVLRCGTAAIAALAIAMSELRHTPARSASRGPGR